MTFRSIYGKIKKIVHFTRDTMSENNEHAGHRQRLIKKLESGGLVEHEYLELLLFNVFTRRNTNDLAHRLLSAFGSIRGVFKASVDELCSVDGIGPKAAAYLFTLGRIFEQYMAEENEQEPVYPASFEHSSFTAYVKRAYAKERVEVLDFYLLESNLRVKARKRFTAKNDRFVEVDADAISKLLSLYNPSGIVVVHNHPYGSSKPSKKDDETTKRIQLTCSVHNVLFCDHIIYSPVDVYSYYAAGKMQEIAREFSVGAILKRKEE